MFRQFANSVDCDDPFYLHWSILSHNLLKYCGTKCDEENVKKKKDKLMQLSWRFSWKVNTKSEYPTWTCNLILRLWFLLHNSHQSLLILHYVVDSQLTFCASFVPFCSPPPAFRDNLQLKCTRPVVPSLSKKTNCFMLACCLVNQPQQDMRNLASETSLFPSNFTVYYSL